MLRPHPVLCLTPLVGCFAAEAPDSAPAHDVPVSLSLLDPHGARYPSEAAPRQPTLRLAFAGAPPATPVVRLLRGELRAALVAALPARSERLAGLEVPLARVPEPDALTLTPTAPLAPGARYTLVWGEGSALLTFALATSASPALGAVAVASWPADQARDVPPNLARALVRFDGALSDDDDAVAAHLTLRDARGVEVPSRLGRAPCDALGLPAGSCAWRTPSAPLAPGAYALSLAAGLTAPTGAPVAPVTTTFTVGAVLDTLPPALEPGPCERDELPVADLCVRLAPRTVAVRGRTREPAEVALLPGPCAALAGDRGFALTACPRDPAVALTLQLRDLAGHTEVRALPLPPPPALAAITIDALRIDPRGPEPAQEYVELLSSAPHPVSLMGFTLSTDRDRARTVVGSPTLLPGARALVVGPDFDAAEASDGALPPGLALIRLDRALGLPNQGARVVLRDAASRQLSVATAPAPLLEGQCSARRSDDPPEAPLALDPDGACTPGRSPFARRE